jgi:hypothetical protein
MIHTPVPAGAAHGPSPQVDGHSVVGVHGPYDQTIAGAYLVSHRIVGQHQVTHDRVAAITGDVLSFDIISAQLRAGRNRHEPDDQQAKSEEDPLIHWRFRVSKRRGQPQQGYTRPRFA